MGFKDGTMNVKAEDAAAVDEHVWVPTDADSKGTWLALSEYIQHTGSALFAVPPGIAEGEYTGQSLFA
jgi:deferrochelatase/peroxidase EfeB